MVASGAGSSINNSGNACSNDIAGRSRVAVILTIAVTVVMLVYCYVGSLDIAFTSCPMRVLSVTLKLLCN